eukprot:385057-Alexandrium_andersonii.AAC.1
MACWEPGGLEWCPGGAQRGPDADAASCHYLLPLGASSCHRAQSCPVGPQEAARATTTTTWSPACHASYGHFGTAQGA